MIFRVRDMFNLYFMGDTLCRRPPTIAHCSKIVASSRFCKQILDLWCPNLSFVRPGASTLASWWALGRCWAPHGLGFLVIFGVRDPGLEAF